MAAAEPVAGAMAGAQAASSSEKRMKDVAARERSEGSILFALHRETLRANPSGPKIQRKSEHKQWLDLPSFRSGCCKAQ